MPHFQRIGLLASLDVPEVRDSLNKLEAFLLAQGREVVYEERAAKLVDWPVDKVLPIGEFSGAVDLGIVVGGDGSMLSASRQMAASKIPLLGINRGRLGFLTDISPDEIAERVLPVLSGEYKQTSRFVLETSITRQGTLIAEGLAVNDIVLHPGQSVRMMAFELYVDGEFVYSQRSDGLIVATPTGSTAYALSAGGPLLCPELDAMVVVPLNPHTLSSRPIALHGDAQIEIRVSSRNELQPLITCDGHNDYPSEPGDIISIRKHRHEIILIHPKDHNFYSICRSKLGWGSRLDGVKARNDS
ncbi:NAD(+) kinase [Porticoccaceae bacterium]|jgi:NAD+ kinase|nr:NAD(+) kinase [Porticoccaceae bacterium]